MSETENNRGQHDIGGMNADALIDQSEHRLSLSERRVDAMMNLLFAPDRKIFNIDEMRRAIETLPTDKPGADDVADLCAAFQAAVGDVVVDRSANAIKTFQKMHPDGDTLVVSGGVAANAASIAGTSSVRISRLRALRTAR